MGGFDLAAEWMGWQNVFHCEWNPFGQKVLKHYWPNAELFTDITKSDFKKYHGTIDIISGGFPCQPYSAAGKRLGKEDDRHLWPEMLRAIQEIQPKWVVGENVLGLTNWNGGMVFNEVQTDLEAQGYKVQPYVLPSASVGAPHRRDRIFFVAYRNVSNTERFRLDKCEDTAKVGGTQAEVGGQGNKFTNAVEADGKAANATDTERKRCEWLHKTGDKNFINGESTKIRGSFTGHNKANNWDIFPTQSPICGRNDGIPNRLDGITFPKWRNESIKAYGNAVVPQVVYQIFKAIEQYEQLNTTTT